MNEVEEHSKKKDFYQLRVMVSPDIQAFLFLERARTGKNTPQLIEEIIKEWAAARPRQR